MPVVTISRQFGAGGSTVAEMVAARIGAEVVDKGLVAEVGRRLGLTEAEVAQDEERPRPLLERLVRSFASLEPAVGIGWTPPYNDPLFDPRQAVIELTEEIVREVAKTGNAVIVGRGASFILRDRPSVLRVFLRAPEEARLKVVMKRFGMAQDEARRKMLETDANRQAYIKQLYHRDWCDPDEFDLILNTDRLGYEATAEIVLRALGKAD